MAIKKGGNRISNKCCEQIIQATGQWFYVGKLGQYRNGGNGERGQHVYVCFLFKYLSILSLILLNRESQNRNIMFYIYKD